jgi:hypothetical protein
MRVNHVYHSIIKLSKNNRHTEYLTKILLKKTVWLVPDRKQGEGWASKISPKLSIYGHGCIS